MKKSFLIGVLVVGCISLALGWGAWGHQHINRAAVFALPEPQRVRYARHLAHLTQCAMQLLICLDYDQQLMAGPPFAVDGAEVARLYQDGYDLKALGSAQIPEGLKGKVPATESVWLLSPRLR